MFITENPHYSSKKHGFWPKFDNILWGFANFSCERLESASKSISKLIFFFIYSHQDWYDETWKIKQMIFMKVHEEKNGFISPFINELLRIFARKSGLWKYLLSHFGVLVLNYSSSNTVFCLHRFVRVSKKRVSGGLPVSGIALY